MLRADDWEEWGSLVAYRPVEPGARVQIPSRPSELVWLLRLVSGSGQRNRSIAAISAFSETLDMLSPTWRVVSNTSLLMYKQVDTLLTMAPCSSI